MTKKARKLDFYAWYPGHFRQDTQHLTRDERAAYRDILDEIFLTNQKGGWLVDDDDLLARVVQRTPEEWKGMRRVLIDGARPLLKKRGNRIYSRRLGREIRKARSKSKQAKAAAVLKWRSAKDADA